MIENVLRRFCESKHRKLIVIAGTFIVGLVLILPLVDVYSAGLSEKETLLTDLESAREVAGELQGFETRVAEKVAQLNAFERRTVNDASQQNLRDALMEFVKQSQCTIRKLSVGNAVSRPWSPGEDPTTPADAKRSDPNSPYRLEWRPVIVSLTGNSANLKSMVERISTSGMLMHTKSLEMYPSSPNRQTLTLDMELWYFTLARK